MPPRRSKRLRTCDKPDYVESPTSDDEDDDENDSDDNDYIPHDLLMLLHNAITNASKLQMEEDLDVLPKARPRKKKRPDNSKLESPPIHPTNLASLIELCKQCEKTQYVDSKGTQ
jgi:hypothetical protein